MNVLKKVNKRLKTVETENKALKQKLDAVTAALG